MWENIRAIVLALLLALLFRSFFFEPFHIPSGSMKNNLLVGDYLFVSKYAYGYSRYSFPLGLDLFDGRVMADETPKRGDVVVFRLPRNPSIDYIKRLIGLPGDRIQVKNSELYINGEAVPRSRVGVFGDDISPRRRRGITSWEETLPNDVRYNILQERTTGRTNNTPEYIVPEGHFFFMGDNRDNSRDSRFLSEVGYVPLENIVGRAEMILFSTDGSAQIWEVWKWPSSLRSGRFFKTID